MTRPNQHSAPLGPDQSAEASGSPDAVARRHEEPVVAPGYQAALFPPPPARRVRWRAVRRDGTRLPAVGELGVVIAQARTLAGADGQAWIVGSDHHTLEVTRAARAGFTVTGCGPRWTQTVRMALSAASRAEASPGGSTDAK
jgi:hypothetical protein